MTFFYFRVLRKKANSNWYVLVYAFIVLTVFCRFLQYHSRNCPKLRHISYSAPLFYFRGIKECNPERMGPSARVANSLHLAHERCQLFNN